MTLDNAWDATPIVTAVTPFWKKVTTRVVFDPGVAPTDYLSTVKKIHLVANVLGEPVDSEPENTSLTVAQYRQRFSTYMTTLGKNVDIWEIGNEVNGEWTGPSATMAQKISGAFQEAKSRQIKTALTLFYSDDSLNTDREMVTWSRKYLSSTVLNGVDYVLVSFYPTTATGSHPNWTKIFTDLAALYPNAKLGFGELGLANEDGTLSTNAAAKKALIQRYYKLADPIKSRFVGGYFWWEFQEDAVPKYKPLWRTFFDLIR
ncbi:putative transmembrane protein [Fimbriimonas ginsengisoli Gsoil 348]|uniref:Putative transmembrane protein n=1 Tax=Fimbriimonas ginsengisoli Gsoil 348 TaxID=661478 RepID=A0A068NWS1_FIMGI|nr:putative transmembrane protein [Fimbriimonas ginsengisoli Gsoil 348]